ncbi:membrane protein insertase YidC [Candidatus Microgenomates bacterium]|nr:MAG: membrane protein insertase YidC [Candidatus Microgenomates bacterium]
MTEFFYQILLFFYNNLAFQNLGLAIIEISVITRIVTHPLTKQQLVQARKMREIQPKINALKVKHKGDNQALSQAQLALFKEHGVNPAGGCLPAIIPLVILIGLSGAVQHAFASNGDINAQFLIWDLSKPDTINVTGIPFALPGLLVIATAASQYFYSKLVMPTPPKVRKEDKPAEKEEKQDFMASFAEAQSSMMWMFPLLFLYIGTQWAAALPLYWTVTSVVSIAQHWQINRTSPKTS